MRETVRVADRAAAVLRDQTAMARQHKDPDAGSTLVEVILATLVMTSGVLAMIQLVSVSTANNVFSRNTTVATILAVQKLEQLRALAWGVGANGLPISDLSTDTAVDPESPIGGTGLQISPAGSLLQNTPGFVDYLNVSGQIVGGGSRAPQGALYTRRWSIEPAVGDPDALILQVVVTPRRNSGAANRGAAGRLPGEARVVTLKGRKAP